MAAFVTCWGAARPCEDWKARAMAYPPVFVFDCDGTLLDSMGMWLSCQPKLLASYGVETTPDDFARFEHLSFEDECAAYHETWGVGNSGKEVLDRFNDMLDQEYSQNIVVLPGVVDFLESASEAGIALAIATSTPAHLVRLGLSANGLDRFFPEVTTTGEAGRSKEHPDVYDLALRRACERCNLADVSRSDVWVFEDAPFGLRSAGRAGYNTVGIFDPAGRGTREEVFSLADIAIDSFKELSLKRIAEYPASSHAGGSLSLDAEGRS